ncbi:MAG TPA: hypothetical protein VEH06_00210 [Candidatus Bathyarchaeia archaeon]|nr:hypothetical protein [Candidatus Bathyarchaeia archaeon]
MARGRSVAALLVAAIYIACRHRGSSRANKGNKYWLGLSIKMEKAFPKRGVHSYR